MFPELPGLILYIYHPHCMYYSQELLVPIWPGLALYIRSWDFGAALPWLSHLHRIEVSHGYHKGGCSWIFAKFSHHYGTHHVNVYFSTTSQFLLRVFQLPEHDFSMCPINVWVVLGQRVID